MALCWTLSGSFLSLSWRAKNQPRYWQPHPASKAFPSSQYGYAFHLLLVITGLGNCISPLLPLWRILMCYAVQPACSPWRSLVWNNTTTQLLVFNLWLLKGKINFFLCDYSNGLCLSSPIYFPELLQERELAKVQFWENESSVCCSLKGTGCSWYLHSLLKVFSQLDYLPTQFLVSDSHWL